MPMRNQAYKLLQLFQPSRPIHGYNMYFESSTPRDRLLHQYRNPEPFQFAQPPSPVNSMSPKPCTPENRYQYQFYDSGLMQIPQSPRPIATYNMSYPYHMPQERYPTRPMQGYNMYCESCTPRNKFLHQYRNPEPIQFAQPTSPISSMSPRPCMPENRYHQFYDSGLMPFPQSPKPIGTYNMSYTYNIPQERYPYPYLDQGHIPTTMPMTTEEGSEAVDDITKGNSELYSRLPANLLSQLNLDRINTTTMSRGLKLNQHSTRGLHGQAEELSHKLQRFKIRTIDLGEIVNGEEEQR